MLVPLSWLKEYVHIDVSTEELCDRMTMTGSNVETVIRVGEDIEGVVVGKILTIEKHPNADRLVICKVDIGDRIIQVVTGAPNISNGDLVPVALDGAHLPGDVLIKKGKLRGVVSEGMLCSGEELDLTDQDYQGAEVDGILILREEYPLGIDIREALLLNDEIIEFEITPNRPDCLSIIGIAREAATTIGSSLSPPNIELSPCTGNIYSEAKVVVKDKELCPRYCARVVDNIRIGESPLWMKRRLINSGIRPINNIVDITNYVMLEMGQPMHAFDLDKVEDRTIVVRRAKAGETLVTLDDVDRELKPNMLVIADANRPIGLAGIMGGANTEITEDTNCIILESAKFDGPSVRFTSKELGLRSEASTRFEKGIDINLPREAIDRAAQLIQELDVGNVVDGVIDILNSDIEPYELEVRWMDINNLLGLELTPNDMVEILKSLNFGVRHRDDILDIVVPTYRQDISGMEDIAEEIARIYGYDNIPKTLMDGTVSRGRKTERQKKIDYVRDILIGSGLYEIITYSFISPKAYDMLGKEMPEVVTILNPLGEDQSIMRTTLMFSMLEVLARNKSRKVESCSLFEIGKIFIPKSLPLKELPEERQVLSMGIYGNDMDFYNLKGVVELMLHELGLFEKTKFVPVTTDPTFHPGRTAAMKIEHMEVGILGEVHPKIRENYGFNIPILLAEIDLDAMLDLSNTQKYYRGLPKFPAVERDLAIVVKKDVLAAEIYDIIKESGGDMLETVELFDIYEGDQIPEGYKSMAYSLSYRAPDRTLQDKEVDVIHERIINTLEKKVEAKLR